MKKIILTIVLSILIQFAFATDYYVSSSTGNDSNDGLTTSTAWKTLTKIRQATFIPGDIIHFKRGDLWKEGKGLFIDEQGTAANPIIFTDYGSGDLPEISLIETLDNNLPWVDEGNNIWSIVLDDNLVTNSAIPWWTYYHKLKRLFINGAEVLGAAVGYDEELGTNIPDQVQFLYKGFNDRLLKVYTTTNPNNLLIELSFEQYPIHIQKYGTETPMHIIVENFKTIGGDIASVYVAKGHHIIVRNIEAGTYAQHGIDIGANTSYITVDNCIIDSKYTFDYTEAGVGYKSNRGPSEGFYIRGGDHIEFMNSIVKNFTHANINVGKSSDTNSSEYNKIHDNITSSNLAYGGRTVIEDGTHYLEYYNNTIDGSGVQNQFNGQNNHYHHNIIKNVRSSSLTHYHSGWGISVSPYSNGEDAIDNIFENNIIMDCESGGITIQNSEFAVVANNIFRNNILINNGKFVAHFTGFTQNQSSNIDLAIKIQDRYDWTNQQFVAPFTSGNTFQNNIIYNSSNPAKILYHLDNSDPNGWTTLKITVAEFNNQNGQHNDIISNNIEADPKFIDLINGDYHLQETSPAVNAGTTATATIDMDDNAIPFPGTLPDIGLFEYQVQTTNHPPTATNVVITGVSEVGQTLTLNYDFNDEDGDTENGSIIAWSTPTLELQRSTSATFVIPTGYCGDTIGAWVHPIDSTGNTPTYGVAASNNMLDITCSTASIASIDRDTFTIYPNPATNFLTIKNQQDFKNYSIINMVGQKIASGSLNEETININTLEKGIYFIELSNEEKSMIKQFIKKE